MAWTGVEGAVAGFASTSTPFTYSAAVVPSKVPQTCCHSLMAIVPPAGGVARSPCRMKVQESLTEFLPRKKPLL